VQNKHNVAGTSDPGPKVKSGAKAKNVAEGQTIEKKTKKEAPATEAKETVPKAKKARAEKAAKPAAKLPKTTVPPTNDAKPLPTADKATKARKKEAKPSETKNEAAATVAKTAKDVKAAKAAKETIPSAKVTQSLEAVKTAKKAAAQRAEEEAPDELLNTAEAKAPEKRPKKGKVEPTTQVTTATGGAAERTEAVKEEKPVRLVEAKRGETTKEDAEAALPKWEHLTQAQLKEECKKRRLKVTGSKQQLVERLQEATRPPPAAAVEPQPQGPVIRIIVAEKKCKRALLSLSLFSLWCVWRVACGVWRDPGTQV
jgi:hypothetical protein